MRAAFHIAFAWLAFALAASAGPEMHQLSIALGTNTTGSATTAVSGYIDAVYASVSDGTSTGTVTISYAPLLGSTAINIATNVVADEKVWRPRVDATDVAGAALTGDPPVRHAMAGETITFAVSGSPTGLTWKAVLVVEPGSN